MVLLILPYPPASRAGAALADSCLYCSHCQPCPVGLDIARISRCLDEGERGVAGAFARYGALPVPASACMGCGLCERNCPYHLAIRQRMGKAALFFESEGDE